MQALYRIAFVTAVLCSPLAAQAIDVSQVPKDKHTSLNLYLTPQEAWSMLQKESSQILFIDVRTRAEVSYVGMPLAADALVPFVEHDPFWAWDDQREGFKLEPLQDFVAEANRRLSEKGLTKDDKVFVMCRSGPRAALAANRLAEDGFTQVYNLVEGFEGDTSKNGADKGQRTVNGWKNAGLPWSYKLDKKKMYLTD